MTGLQFTAVYDRQSDGSKLFTALNTQTYGANSTLWHGKRYYQRESPQRLGICTQCFIIDEVGRGMTPVAGGYEHGFWFGN